MLLIWRRNTNSVLEDGDETDLMLALRTLSKAFGGVQEIARQADVNAHTRTEPSLSGATRSSKPYRQS